MFLCVIVDVKIFDPENEPRGHLGPVEEGMWGKFRGEGWGEEKRLTGGDEPKD